MLLPPLWRALRCDDDDAPRAGEATLECATLEVPLPLPLPWGSGEGIRKVARMEDEEVGVVDEEAADADVGEVMLECSDNAASVDCFDEVDDDDDRVHCG